MSQATSLPGAERFSQNMTFFGQATCPRRLRCSGQNFFSNYEFFLHKPLVPGSFAAWGRTFSRKMFFLMKPLVPGSFAAWGRIVSQKMCVFFEEATCPVQLRCLGQNFFSKNDFFFEEATCPGQLRCLGQNCFSKNDFFF